VPKATWTFRLRDAVAKSARQTLFGITFLAAGGFSALPAMADVVEACVPQGAHAVDLTGQDADGLFQGADGRRYLAVDLSPFDARATHTGPEHRLTAVAAGPANRWGMVPAWILTSAGEETRLHQAEALLQGVAVFSPGEAAGACANLLRSAERTARQERAGLWSDPSEAGPFATYAPKSFQGKAGAYVVARGRIVSLGKTSATRYLNFGRHWKTDLTVTLKSSDEDKFNDVLGATGWMIEDLAGRTVEVRGLLEERDGPYMALRHPEQLIVIEGKRAGRGGQNSN